MLSLKASCHRIDDLFYGKTLVPSSKNIPRPDASVEKSQISDFKTRHTLLFGKPLRAFSTKRCFESSSWPRFHLGMVIMERIGQSACLLPKNVTQVHGRASETERVWVSNDRLAILTSLKIQSSLYGNIEDEYGHTPTKFIV